MATTEDQHGVVWRSRLGSALRTTLACSVVGLTTLYGPNPIRQLLTYPAFSYVTAVLIVSNSSNVGDALRGLFHVIYAMIQVLLFSVPSLWLIGPPHFTPGLAAIAVALTSFVVAVTESSHLLSKRIAFGQIVIVYVGASIRGARTDPVMHPVHVALCTALGGFAAVLALLFPYPQLARSQVRKIYCMYAVNTVERLKLYTDAFSSDDSSAASALISQAMSYSTAADMLLRGLKANEEGMLWERQLRPNNSMNLAETLQEQMELPVRGMEMALTSCSSFPIRRVADEDLLINSLTSLKEAVGQKLEPSKCFFAPPDRVPEAKEDSIDNFFLHTFTTTTPMSREDLPAMFFMFCAGLLYRDPPTKQTPFSDSVSNNSKDPANNGHCFISIIRDKLISVRPSNQSLVFGLKCSISLGLAVLFGLIYNKEEGYWSGLAVAVSFVTGRHATFTVANARAQGTAMGSAYGILMSSFIFQGSMDYLRLLPLLPWIIFASLLRHSRMYGEAGGTSAVVGALLVLGRRSHSTPTEFAVARITEASIGLLCFVGVEFLLEPARAATLATTQLSKTLAKLGQQCMTTEEKKSGFLLLKSHINAYETYIREAEVEPDFWFLSFPKPDHVALLGSFARIVDLLEFLVILEQLLSRIGFSWKDMEETDIELVKERLCSSFECLGNVTDVSKELKKNNVLHDDVELDKLPKEITKAPFSSCISKQEAEKFSTSFLRDSNEVMDQMINARGGDAEVTSQIALCLGGIGFCIDKMMEETVTIKASVEKVMKKYNHL